MRKRPLNGLFLFLAGALFVLTACSGGSQAGDTSQDCRETPAAKLTPSGHGCALAAEMRAIAETLATVTDQASAERAAPLLRESGARLKSLRTERVKLNDAPLAGAKGAAVGVHMPSMSAPSRKIIDEASRIARQSPQAFEIISAAMEGIEL